MRTLRLTFATLFLTFTVFFALNSTSARAAKPAGKAGKPPAKPATSKAQEAVQKARKLVQEEKYGEAAELVTQTAREMGKSIQADRLRVMAIQIRAMDYLQGGGKAAPLNELAEEMLEKSSGQFKEISYIVAGDIFKLTGQYDRAEEILKQYLQDYPAPSKDETQKYQKRRDNAGKQMRQRMPQKHPRTLQREKARQSLKRMTLVGEKAPAFTVKTVAGKSVSPADYRGKVLVIDFWASDSNAFVQELPEIKSVYKQYHPEGLEILGLSLDEKKSKMKTFIKDNSLPWNVAYLEGEKKEQISQLYGVPPSPAMFLVDSKGIVRAQGMTLRGKGLEKAVARLMENK